MFDFYVINGKKLIDYKPKYENYHRAYIRKLEYLSNSEEFRNKTMKEVPKDEIAKLTYLMIRCIVTDEEKVHKLDIEETKNRFALISITKDLISLFTPREFMRMFPIKKEYDGRKYECKDYFSTMKELEEIGLDNKIGDNALDMLWGYQNWDIIEFEIYSLEILSRINILQGGKDLITEFAESQGLDLKPNYITDDGTVLDDEGNAVGKVKKPRKKATRLFSV